MIGTAVRLGLRELWANRLRTMLTTLGIVIGVAAVVVLVTLGRGVSAQISKEFDALGGNLLFVSSGGQFARAPTDQRPFEHGDLAAIRRHVTGIRAATALTQTRGRLAYGGQNRITSILGTDNDYFRIRQWIFSHGRAFSDAELRAGTSVCIIGAELAATLFAGQRPVGARIRVKDIHCEIVGVLAAKGKGLFGDSDDNAMILPLKTVERRLLGRSGFDAMEISVISAAAMEDVADQIRRLLRERRKVRHDEPDSFMITDLRSFTAQIQDILGPLTLFLSAVAFVSLVVGGIGVMNVMLVSVTERTREIGVRLSIGAQENDVLLQFLIEAMLLCLAGCAFGIGLGYGIAAIAAAGIGVPFLPDPLMAAYAIAFSIIFGFAFGYAPARRAARLDPIEALRFE